MTRFGFVTCVQLGLSCLEAIYEIGGTVDLLVSLPDEMAGQKSGRIYLDDFAQRHRIALFKTRHINDEAARAALAEARLDWLFIVGWSQIAGPEVLAIPRQGVIGMHPTLLPQGRGRAAIPWAILKGLDKTGVTMFQMDSGVDTGPIIAQVEVPLGPDTDASELYAAIDAAHVKLMRSAFPQLAAGTISLSPQNEEAATIWPGRKPEDGRIDLTASVYDAERLVRAVTRPYPGAFVDDGHVRTIIWQAEVAGNTHAPTSASLSFRDGVLVLKDWERTALRD